MMWHVVPALLTTMALASAGLQPSSQADPEVRIVQLAGQEVLVGRVEFEAAVTPPESAVQYVAFFVDGQQVCRVTMRPFRCAWDAGRLPRARSLRVVAECDDGLRLVSTLRTRAPNVSQPSFFSSIDAITVPVRVRDGRGRPVSGLAPEHFRVLEDGVPQAVGSLVDEMARPSVFLALDMSASMEPVLADLRRAAETFLDGVRTSQSVSVAAFNSGLFVLARPGSDRAVRRAALGRLRPWGGTALYDSLVRAVELVKQQPEPRVIVAFTDGEDVASMATIDTVRSALLGTDVVLYLVVRANRPAVGSPGAALSAIAAETGGSAWFTSRMSGLGAQFAEVVADLSTRYVLTYAPSRPLGDGGWREVTVEVVGADRQYQVEARQGYFAVAR